MRSRARSQAAPALVVIKPNRAVSNRLQPAGNGLEWLEADVDGLRRLEAAGDSWKRLETAGTQPCWQNLLETSQKVILEPVFWCSLSLDHFFLGVKVSWGNFFQSNLFWPLFRVEFFGSNFSSINFFWSILLGSKFFGSIFFRSIYLGTNLFWSVFSG